MIAILVAIFSVSGLQLNGQEYYQKGSIYSINKKVELSLTLALFMSNYVGFQYLNKKDPLTVDEINALDANDIWWLDRIATQQDPDTRNKYHNASDVIMNVTIALPALLVVDKNIRKDWLDLLVLYMETHALNSSLYLGVSAFTNRIRPFVYHPDIAIEDKTISGTRESFFSGHTSTTATASFFMAKVYSDYHPELGNKKYWVFGAALIPPLVVGALRVKAMKHFPTDIASGIVVGAAMGILVPHLHKKKKNKNLSFIPVTGAVNGLLIHYTIR